MQVQSNSIKQSDNNQLCLQKPQEHSDKNNQQPEQRFPHMFILQVQNNMRCFRLQNLNQAFETMIKLYCQAQIQSSVDQKQIMFTLEDLVKYYQSFSNILFMQPDNSSMDSSSKLKSPAIMYNKQYMIGCFKMFCKKQAYQNSKNMANQYFNTMQQNSNNPQVQNRQPVSTEQIMKLVKQT